MSPDGVTGLGMPGMPPPTPDPTWKQAWDAALYGPTGYLRSHPAVFLRDSEPLIDFIAARARGLAAREVVLLGSAGMLAPPLSAAVGPGVHLRGDLPADFDGLLVAIDWLAHVPCHVVVADDAGSVRIVHVDPVSGRESPGSSVDDPVVPQSIETWLEQYWPLTTPGSRAEVGTARDAAWRDVVRRMSGGCAIAIEAGHTATRRPPLGSLRDPRGEAFPVPDGARDLVADVALDSVADATDGSVLVEAWGTRVEVPISQGYGAGEAG